MTQLPPAEILNWMNTKDFNPDNFSNNSLIGCFLEVDLGYWNNDLSNDYFLAGKKRKTTVNL